MTLPEIQSLTSEQRRIIVAERCGWKYFNFKDLPGGCHMCGPSEKWCHSQLWKDRGLVEGKNGNVENLGDLPDYDNDLNAAAQMEATLTRDQRGEYVRFLQDVLKVWGTYEIVTASASQRVTAFLAATEVEDEKG